MGKVNFTNCSAYLSLKQRYSRNSVKFIENPLKINSRKNNTFNANKEMSTLG